MHQKTNLPQDFFKFVWHFLRNYKLFLFGVFVTSVACGFYGPFFSLLMKKIINSLPEVKQSGNYSGLIKLSALFVLNFVIFDHITWRFASFLNLKYLPVIKNQITKETFEFTLGHSHSFFGNNLSGKISKQIGTIADKITEAFHQIVHQLLRGSSLFCIAFFVFFSQNPKFLYVFLSWFLVFSIGSFFLSRKLIDLSDKSAEKEAEVNGQITDSISNSNNVRIFGRKTFEISRLTNFLFERKKAFRDLEFAEIILALFQGSMIALMFAGMLFFLVKLYVLSQVSEGDFALILNLSMDVAYITWFCSFLVKDLIRSIGECRQALKSLIIPYEIKEDLKNGSAHINL